MLNWSEVKRSQSCKRISFSCNGRSEFPSEFTFPNLSLLKLMHGDELLKFSDNFYDNMDKLQVIAYEQMNYPLLPSSFQCSTNLQTLCLHKCLLKTGHLSSIGNLLNLEVLSLANSGIEWLPSTIGNLKKLRFLDLTGCCNLVIDDGVLKNLVKLEELYMRVYDKNAICFTENNYSELAERSENLSTLEVEFSENIDYWKNISYEKLERFKISVGCLLNEWGIDMPSYGNTLKLVTKRSELLESKMNELFVKTEVLWLQVDNMKDLEDVEIKFPPDHPPKGSSFYNLRVLLVIECADLNYLFTIGVATALSKLEYLTISSCPIMEELIHIDENNRADTITFPKLKILVLAELPKLSSLCNNVNVIELPQLLELLLDGLPNFTSIYSKNKVASSSMTNTNSTTRSFLKEEVVIPKLEVLAVNNMKNLMAIWSYQFNSSNVCLLTEIDVRKCDSLVNLFPRNPMSVINHLEELKVEECGSIEVLFNIDMGCIGKMGQVNSRSSLRRIEVFGLKNLREVWRIKAGDGNYNSSSLPVCGFQAVERISIEDCTMFRNIFTPATTNFDMGALVDFEIRDCGESQRNNELVKSNRDEEIDVISCVIHNFHHLRKLYVHNYKGVGVVFEIESLGSSRELPRGQNTRQLVLPYLEEIELWNMDMMSHVWKCWNWNEFLILQKQYPQSSFHSLTTIKLCTCNRIKYMFSPLMAKLLSNLKKIQIEFCESIEEIVSNRDDNEEDVVMSSHTNTTFFPHFDRLDLVSLGNLKRIDGGSKSKTAVIADQLKFSQVRVFPWSLCQYSREIRISQCWPLSSVVPFYAVGQMQKLENLKIKECGITEVFETQRIDNNSSSDDVATSATLAIPRLENLNVPQLSNLKIMEIVDCGRLQHVVTFSTLKSLIQLEVLKVKDCRAMKVIVIEENGDQTRSATEVVIFPHLKCLALVKLPNLEGFFLGTNDFQWPQLNEVHINNCPKIKVFTSGQSIAPEVKYIHTRLGKQSLPECGLNFHVTTTVHQSRLPSSESSSSFLLYLERFPLSFHYLIEMDVEYDDQVIKMIPSNELQQLKKFEKIHLCYCWYLKEVFEVVASETNTESGSNDSQSVVEIPNLREVVLESLYSFKYIWKSNKLRVLNFPSLTTLTIDHCPHLEHVFTSSMVGSLLKLQELHISDCPNMEVIVKEEEKEECDVKVKEIVLLPLLKSLKLHDLSSLQGFCLEKEAFSMPLLDKLEIKRCLHIKVFTEGPLNTPELKLIDAGFRKWHVGEDLNSFINNKQQEGFQF